jgi:hypothetical protein
MGYVKECDRTTAWYLFNKLFLCRIPQLATRTVDDLKEFGVFSTGDAIVDREMAKDWVSRWLSIAQMEHIFTKGFPIKVVNYGDTKKIYELISAHLLTWREFFETAENNRVPAETVDELVNLDKLASEVYKPAKHLFTEEIAQSLFSQALRRTRTRSLLSRTSFNRQQEVAPARPDPTVQVSLEELAKPVEKVSNHPERFSLSKIFERQRSGDQAWK